MSHNLLKTLLQPSTAVVYEWVITDSKCEARHVPADHLDHVVYDREALAAANHAFALTWSDRQTGHCSGAH